MRNTASLTEILEAEHHYKLTTSFLKEHNLQIKGKDNKKRELKNSIMQFQTRAIYQIYYWVIIKVIRYISGCQTIKSRPGGLQI
jgi:hypothetical protein